MTVLTECRVVEINTSWMQVTMSSLVNALESAGQWQLAISKFEELRGMGIRPNVICYNATISALAKGSQVPLVPSTLHCCVTCAGIPC